MSRLDKNAAKGSKSERNKRFAKIWSLSRSDAGKTQEYMASGLGVSKKTIQNWEKGVSAPDLYEGSEWFRVLGSNPMPYYLAFLYPWLFDGITPEDDDQDIEQTLLFLVKNMTAVEKREMLYLMAGRHGSPWYSLLQMFTAHCHCSLRSRVTAARTILETTRWIRPGGYGMSRQCAAGHEDAAPRLGGRQAVCFQPALRLRTLPLVPPTLCLTNPHCPFADLNL